MGINTVGNLTIQTLEMARQFELAIMRGNGTSPVTPLSAAQTTSASIGGIVDAIVGIFKPLSNSMNITASDPLISGFMRSLFFGFGIPGVVIPDEPFTNTSDPRLRSLMGLSPSIQRNSLLSDVSFLKNLTRNTWINRQIISVAEGYVITFLVVVCFILVFLIREWVVQQQPGINMAAGFNAEFPGDRNPREIMAGVRENLELNRGRPALENPPEARDVADRPIAQPRRRHLEADLANHPEGFIVHPQSQGTLNAMDLPSDITEGSGQTRPGPVRDLSSQTMETQRQLTGTPPPRLTEEFLAIWRRADGVADDVLRIIEEENKIEEMRYWVNVMEHLKESCPTSVALDPIPSSPFDIRATSTGSPTAPQAGSDGGSGTPDSWADVAKPISYRKKSPVPQASGQRATENIPEGQLDNGKGKAREDVKEPLFDPTAQLRPDINKWNQGPVHSENPQTPSFAATTSRPRAISDGPQPKDSISPLANNNWTFWNLDKENVDPRTAASEVVQEDSEGPRQWEFNPKAQLSLPDDRTPGSSSWKAAQDLRAEPYMLKTRPSIAADRPSTESSLSGLDGPNAPTPDRAENPNEGVNGPNEVACQDGITHACQNIDEMFAANPVGDSDSEDGKPAQDEPEPNPFAPDTPSPPLREPIAIGVPEPRGILGNMAEFLWGDIDQQEDEGTNDEHVVQDIAAEAPFVPVAHQDPFDEEEEFLQPDPNDLNAAIADPNVDPNDPDAMDDAEDFEGVMELIGMRGPLFSLVQNALFCSLLLSLMVAFGVWIPYNIGRVFLLLVANPGPTFKLPLRLVFWCAAFVQDLVVSFIGLVTYCLVLVLSLPLRLFVSSSTIAVLAASVLKLAYDAIYRILDGTLTSAFNFSDAELFMFSAASHEALLTLKYLVLNSLDGFARNVAYLFVGDYEVAIAGTQKSLLGLLLSAHKKLDNFPAFLAKPDTWVISLEATKRSSPLDLELSVWDGADRFWAILAGYTALSVLGILYVKKGTPFSNGVGREWEAAVIDLLHQAGGVMKVILIISIEMLVFPLYCGLLLDAALLPLFESATIMSRILFTVNSPLTSIFVHWFVGTCYMFHFALFVSMCRKIMRKGVLYFIRDPDDPTFHPVRDVLERNIATQLRKILFSALVYGALVVICLGGVVWGLSLAFRGVLPIHWSSNEPVLEFPIDLLFYNFLMPLAVKLFKPSDGLHSMYSWWFRQCARMLRLTWFMFDERRLDEEGYNVRRTWGDVIRRTKGNPLNMVKTDDPKKPFIENPEMVVYFRQDGRYVRAPASDQVRIPQGTRIFLQVDELNNRIDGHWDYPEGVHGRNSDLYKQVYVPPHFRLRICAFILSIWVFAALTGVCITIVPLVFGRTVFAKIIPSHVRKNDVYAFSIGIYILGSALYAIIHLRPFIVYSITLFSFSAKTPRNILKRVTMFAALAARIIWTYSAFIFLLPTLFAFVVEFYAILPLHTYFSPDEPHTIHFVQSWTLGLLYVKLTTRLILLYAESRPAISLRAITRNGYLNPDARVATRSFILPASFALGTAIACPWLLAKVTLVTLYRHATVGQAVLFYRYSYPVVFAGLLSLLAAGWLVKCVKGWRMRIRDEVYLIGERLHNFGERKSGTGANVVGVRRIET